MRVFPLRLHPVATSPVTRIEVEVRRAGAGLLQLTYRLSVAIDRLAVPLPRPAMRADGLWQHTCFEAFLRGSRGYYEFNLSPSSQWAAYRFAAYRDDMRDAPMSDPAIAWRVAGEGAELTASLDLPADARSARATLGISAVIEDREGRKSYWALAHPDGPPDFHHAACFAASLPPAD